MNPIELSIFANRMNAICDEMGAVLRHAAFSPNIRDRLDFSCAVFDADGDLCAQAAHIPVHLGSMAYAMQDIVGALEWRAGDMVIVNDPFLGGTHLPDVTLIAPVFQQDQLIGFVANRAHHADIGADSPGSMPISSHLDEEGVVIPPTHLYLSGELQLDVMTRLTEKARNLQESEGDISAQVSANHTGLKRVLDLLEEMGEAEFKQGLVALNDYGERLALSALQKLPDGEYEFSDLMDDDGQGHKAIRIQAKLEIHDGQVDVDFAGTSDQVKGNINCPLSVAAAAVFYVFRCLMPAQTPACAGSFRSIQLQAPKGCLVNAEYPAAVAAGNVETSTRIVDVIMGALSQAVPQLIPAASHGSMNNLAMGADNDQQRWDYYETMGGGMGAGAKASGLSAVQTHMTNTLNTPIEVLESLFPLRVHQYAVRRGSGGEGEHQGGDGLIREFEFLADAQASLLTERRLHAPWGIAGGEAGKAGINRLNGEELQPKVSVGLKRGDRLSIETPGGGGYGK